jgi:hypothetical protein
MGMKLLVPDMIYIPCLQSITMTVLTLAAQAHVVCEEVVS